MAPEKSIAESEVLCEYCRKSFGPNTILKHIGHVKACKSFYGPRYDELKKEQQRKKVEKFRSKLSIEQRRNVLDRKNKMYAKNPEYRKKQVLENAKRRKKRALDQIEKNKKLQQEKNSRNENSEEKANFVEDEAVEKWQCEFCKTFWIPTSILMHIGNNENCKSHYGPRYGDLKKEHKRVYQEFYREKVGTEKELEQQRKKYMSDPKVKERKKKCYEEDREKQKKPREMERRKRGLKKTAITIEKRLRDENKMCLESRNWIHGFFMHLFETFKEVSIQTKDNIISLEKHIDRIYVMNEFKIDELAENADLAVEEYGGEYPQLRVCDYFRHKIRSIWDDQKKTIGPDLRKIVEEVEEPHKRSDWYCSLKRLNELYVNKAYNRTMEKYFLDEKQCIICKGRAHRIPFDQEIAAKWPESYTYYGTSKIEKAY